MGDGAPASTAWDPVATARPRSSLTGAAIVAGFAIYTMALAIWLFPFDSDAAFVVHDAIWYGIAAEHSPANSINPNHALFHVLVGALVGPLRALGAEAPGHLACRIVSGAAGVWLLLQICACAGWRRLHVGAAFALVLAVSRGFIVDVAAGENVIPATAAGLFALICACRRDQRPWLTAGALVLALMFRQDNILLLPGVATAVAMRTPAGSRVKAVVKLLAVSGIVTLLLYVAAWLVSTRGEANFVEWLPGLGRHGAFAGSGYLEWKRFGDYVFTIAVVMTGRLAPPQDAHPLMGVAYVAVFLAAGVMLLGKERRTDFAIPFALTLAARAVFHTWFEADNFEWLLLPVAMIAAFGAGLARGTPATSLLWRRFGVALLVATSVWIAVAHWRYTWQLRDRSFMRSVEAAASVDRTKWRFLAASVRADQALQMLDIPHWNVKEGMAALDDINRELAEFPTPTTIIWDRGLIDGMPYSLRHVREFVWDFDRAPVPSCWDRLYLDGMVYGVRWTPPGGDSAPASRR